MISINPQHLPFRGLSFEPDEVIAGAIESVDPSGEEIVLLFTNTNLHHITKPRIKIGVDSLNPTAPLAVYPLQELTGVSGDSFGCALHFSEGVICARAKPDYVVAVVNSILAAFHNRELHQISEKEWRVHDINVSEDLRMDHLARIHVRAESVRNMYVRTGTAQSMKSRDARVAAFNVLMAVGTTVVFLIWMARGCR